MIEDLLPMSRWRKTTVFNEFYSRLSMQERLSLSLSFSRPDITGVVAHRSRHPFTERDRSVLNLLRFHVSQACATAKARFDPPFASIMEALDIAGRREHCRNGAWRQSSILIRPAAQEHFESFFPQRSRFSTVSLQRSRGGPVGRSQSFGTCELSVRPPQPLVVRIGERTLRIRIANTREGSCYVLLLRAEIRRWNCRNWVSLGLETRPTEVLYWLAKGKTNKQIGIIMAMATETVKAHLKSIYYRLELENRATAASMISELLVGA